MHCLQNVILTGGKVKIYEKRDAFEQEGSNFERAQIVRLDSRQISMLRYHLGTGFEDVYIPVRMNCLLAFRLVCLSLLIHPTPRASSGKRRNGLS